MCGVAGMLMVTRAGDRRTGPEAPWSVPEWALDELEAGVAARGPDGRGRFRDRVVRADGTVVEVGLVHRRLSIIDHAGGGQPMSCAIADGVRRGRAAVAFNGHIANHRVLRAELEREGGGRAGWERFESDHSDTEVLLRAWAAWGEAAVRRLDGMYAAALWDGARGRLVLVRDRAGEKPLWWAGCGPGAVVFASSAAAMWSVVEAMGGNLRVSRAGVARWVRFGGGLWSESPVEESGAVEPGTVAEVTETGVTTVLRDELPARGSSTGPALTVERADGLIAAAVRGRLDADVPVGVFLSGGVDSGLVAAIARECRAATGAGREPLVALTVRVPWEGYDESGLAGATAAALGMSHQVLECRPDAAADLERLIAGLGVPLSDSSLLPTYWVSRAAAERVKVALGGDGGDEVFGGYERHVGAKWLRRLRPVLSRLRAAEAMGPGARGSYGERLRRMILAARGDGYAELVSVFGSASMLRLWPAMAARAGEAARAERPMAEADPMRWDYLRTLPGDIALKVDTASMACPLEVRSPLLGRGVVDAAMGGPVGALVGRGAGGGGGGRKALLREIARRRGVPTAVVDGRKRGFAVPVGRWLREDYGGLGGLMLDRLTGGEPFGPAAWGIDIDPREVRRLLDEHLGTGLSGVVRADHGARLWGLLALALWCRSLAGAGVRGRAMRTAGAGGDR